MIFLEILDLIRKEIEEVLSGIFSWVKDFKYDVWMIFFRLFFVIV